jgi:hypothetical protein
MLLMTFSYDSWALLSLEGLVLGEVDADIQQDPFHQLFFSRSSEQIPPLNKRLSAYYREGMSLEQSCEFYRESNYADKWSEKQAKRAIAAQLQYYGIDQTLKSISKNAKNLEWDKEQFALWSGKLVDHTCSPNMTVYSHKKIKDNFKYYFDHPTSSNEVTKDDYTSEFSNLLDSKKYAKKEFNSSITLFKSLCSWGGNPEHYRLLIPFLRDPFIMATIFNLLEGKELTIKGDNLFFEKNDSIPRVACQDLICRKVSTLEFNEYFPRVSGSTNLRNDLERLYCQHFKSATYRPTQENNSPVKAMYDEFISKNWIYVQSMGSLLLHSPQLWMMADKPKDLVNLYKENIVNHQRVWANQTLEKMKGEFFWEEPLEMQSIPHQSLYKNEMSLHVGATLGDLDKMFIKKDKIDFELSFKFSKNYLAWIKRTQKLLILNLDYEGVDELKRRLENDMTLQLKKYSSDFPLSQNYEKVAPLLATDLMSQINKKWDDNYQSKDQMIKIPVKFYLGLFALHYINLRSDLD